jgi:hypothetical protein
MAIHKTKKFVYPTAMQNNLKLTFHDDRASAHDSISMGACALDLALIGAFTCNLSFRSRL